MNNVVRNEVHFFLFLENGQSLCCRRIQQATESFRAEEIFIAAEGKYNVKLDGKLQFGMPETMLLRPENII
jgi:hypothetical protein